MYTHRLFTSAALLIGITAAASAQSITSAHSGLLHYFDGKVTIDGIAVDYKAGKFIEIKENSVLKTAEGRAEILLTPGVYLRIGENSEIKMLDNRLLSTRVLFVAGSAVLESDDPVASVKDPAVTLVYKDYQIQPLKYGIFEVSSDPAELKVFKGDATAIAGSAKTTVKEGHKVILSAALLTEKFDEKQVDDLYLWTRDRSAALSAANMASARSLSASGFTPGDLYTGGMYPGLGFNSGFSGGWYLNSMLGMYTYIPFSGTYFSPFGYGFFSPGTIYDFYSPGGYYWYGGGGARTTSFVPQPVAGSVVRTGITGGGSGNPTRLTGGHAGISVPVAGVGSGSVALSRGGGFSPGLARGGGAVSAGGGRFGGIGGGNNNSGLNPGFQNSPSGFGSPGPSGGFSGGGGGASAGGGGMVGAAGGGGGHAGGGGGAPAGGGRAR